MVVSGVPQPRADHVHALAALASTWRTPSRRCATPRAAGGHADRAGERAGGGRVVGPGGSSTTWGDAVNIALPDGEHRPDRAHPGPAGRLRTAARRVRVHPERGDVDIKGKGVMHTSVPGRLAAGSRDEDGRGNRGRASHLIAPLRTGLSMVPCSTPHSVAMVLYSPISSGARVPAATIWPASIRAAPASRTVRRRTPPRRRQRAAAGLDGETGDR